MRGRNPDNQMTRNKVLLVALAMLLSGLSGCGIEVNRPGLDYYFAHPLLNHRWAPDTPVAGTSRSRRTARREPSHTREKARTKKAAGSAAERTAQAPPAQTLRGNDVEVMRREMVLSARRLVGIGETFTQDSFLRHLLVVNNLGIGKLPKEGAVAWLYQQTRAKGDKVDRVRPGDIIFLGDGKPEQAVVVIRADDDGTVAFIGYLANRVQEGVLSLTRQTVRRDESSKKVLNTFVDKTRLAGTLLLGSYSLATHQGALASQGR